MPPLTKVTLENCHAKYHLHSFNNNTSRNLLVISLLFYTEDLS